MKRHAFVIGIFLAFGCGKHNGGDPAAKKTVTPGSTGGDSDRMDNAKGSNTPAVPPPAQKAGSAEINGAPAPNGTGTVGP